MITPEELRRLPKAERAIEIAKLKRDRLERRGNNIENSERILTAYAVTFSSQSNRTHIVIRRKGQAYDFYPTTGTYLIRASRGKMGRGVFSLLREMGINTKLKLEEK